MIITNNEELLRAQCKNVLPEEVGTLVNTLEKELEYANRLGSNGIGLAAPQIGILQKIAIIRLGKIKINLVNSEIIQFYDKVLFQDEGCLSFPSKLLDTYRYQEVQVSNNLVEPYSFIATGFLAIAVQHEIDHFNSTLFMDRMVPKPITVVKATKVGPNEPCPCGQVDLISGKIKKFKKCHGK
jgi:peptide deformylase